jgi:hypothetical protein
MKRILNVSLVLGLLFFISCSDKDNASPNGKAKLEIRLTDDPADYDAINIDIRDVQINVTGDDANGWQSLNGVNKGVYNLLDLVNDKDTLLAVADIPGGKLHQIRLVLGSNNTIVVGGVTLPLETPSAQQSGLKLNVQQDVTAGILYTMLLDFEAAKSVVKTGNNKYILKPVIRTVLEAVGGSIAGNVQPKDITTAVFAIKGNDTVASTFTSATGAFLIKGIAGGTYDVHFLPSDTTYDKAVRTGIDVLAGKVSIVDTVKLTQ